VTMIMSSHSQIMLENIIIFYTNL